MNRKDEKSFKILLRKTGLKSPSPDFTEKTMQKIDAEAAQSVAFEPQLTTLLRRHALKTPPADFTQQIMSRALPPKTTYAPLISPMVWYLVAAAIGLLIGAGWLFPGQTIPTGSPLIGVYKSLGGLSHLVRAVPSSYVLGLSAISALLVVDYLLRYKLLKAR